MVVGAGPTGVEMAGQIAELAHRTLKRDFRAINTRNARVVLVDAAGQVLPPFGAKLGAKTKIELEKLGVEVLLGAMVTDVDERGIEVQYKDGRVERIDGGHQDLGGRRPGVSSLTATLSEQTGAPLDRAGRIGVNPDLTLPGHPEVFVVGDMIDLDHLPGRRAGRDPGRASTPPQRSTAGSAGKPPQKPFKYFDKGSMATISRFRAVALIGKLRLTGVHRLAAVAGRPPRLPDRVQEPRHRGAALGGLVHRPRPVGADRHRAADLRPAGAQPARPRRRRPGLAARARADRRRRAREARRRAELEAIAAEEARLTDAGERGVKVDDRGLTERERLLEEARRGRARVAAGDRLARPPRQDEQPLGLDRDPLGVADLAARPGLDAVDRSIQASAVRSPSGVRCR